MSFTVSALQRKICITKQQNEMSSQTEDSGEISHQDITDMKSKRVGETDTDAAEVITGETRVMAPVFISSVTFISRRNREESTEAVREFFCRTTS